MKSYTDLDQSKKLAELLPLESADAFYMMGDEPVDIAVIYGFVTYKHLKEQVAYKRAVPCWSLAALLGVLPDSIYDNTDEFSQLEFSKKSVAYIQGTTDGIKIGALKDNLVDACYEMILKLHELKML